MKRNHFNRVLVLIISVIIIITLASCQGVSSCAHIIADIGIAFESCDSNYAGWKRVEVPTNTGVRATIQMPQEWDFRVEKGWVKIIDTTTDQLIAEQMYEERKEYENQFVSLLVYNNDIPYDLRLHQDGKLNTQYKYMNIEYKSMGEFLYQNTNTEEPLYVAEIHLGDYIYSYGERYSINGGFLFYNQNDYKILEKILHSSMYDRPVQDYYPDDNSYN
ncbi:MAG: hypothetical protein IKD20_06695 [Clostridia bacterium]|nr:hypothetical protein [Clostridia bacterium]